MNRCLIDGRIALRAPVFHPPAVVCPGYCLATKVQP